jgi:hypothetical protein
MRIRKPSPAMVVAIIALVMASTGSAVAAVNFARNAGAVDRLSAVKANASPERARGRLVATRRHGVNRGRIPGKFLAGVAHADSFGGFFEVQDNAAGAQTLIEATNLGTLNAACNDQAGGSGVEDPTLTITFNNSAGRDLNYFRRVGVADHTVETLVNGTADAFTINAQNNFRIHVESLGVNVVLEGYVRQVGVRTPTGACGIVGTEEQIE